MFVTIGQRIDYFCMFITGVANVLLVMPGISPLYRYNMDYPTSYIIGIGCAVAVLLGAIFYKFTRIGAVAMSYWSGFCISLLFIEGSSVQYNTIEYAFIIVNGFMLLSTLFFIINLYEQTVIFHTAIIGSFLIMRMVAICTDFDYYGEI